MQVWHTMRADQDQQPRFQALAVSWQGFALVMGLLVLFGISRLLDASNYGLGLNGDSFYYLTGAETLAAGVGFGRINGAGDFVPTTHYPPSYSASMAGLQLLGVDKLDSARFVSVLSLALWLALVGVWLRRESASNIPAFVTAAILATSPVVLNVHVWAMSEPPYLGLSFLALFLLTAFIRDWSLPLLAAAALAIAVAMLTRYLGIALVGAGVGLILLQPASKRRKIVACAILLGISLLPMAIWIWRNARLTGNLANRNLLWHPITIEQIEALLERLIDWFVPVQIFARRLELPVLVPVSGMLVAGIAVYFWRTGRLKEIFDRRSLAGLLAIHAAMYMAALGVSLTLFDPATQIDDRILVPIYVSVMMILGLSWYRLWHMHGRRLQLALAAALVSLVATNAIIQERRVSAYGTYGLGNSAPSISQSQTLAAVNGLPTNAPIASNGLARLYFWADRNVYALPWRLDVETGEPRNEYQAELEGLYDRLCSYGGALVLFEPETLLDEQASIEDLTVGMKLYGRYSDGVIYQCAGSSS